MVWVVVKNWITAKCCQGRRRLNSPLCLRTCVWDQPDEDEPLTQRCGGNPVACVRTSPSPQVSYPGQSTAVEPARRHRHRTMRERPLGPPFWKEETGGEEEGWPVCVHRRATDGQREPPRDSRESRRESSTELPDNGRKVADKRASKVGGEGGGDGHAEVRV